MPATLDKERNTWTAQFYYTDFNGVRRRKRRRGFTRKRDAIDWERDFIINHSCDLTLPFEDFTDLYLTDIKNYIRSSSFEAKKYLFTEKILPHFSGKRLCDIKPLDVRAWHTKLLNHHDSNNKPYSQTYLRNISAQLSALFNYAVKYYGLSENPCMKVDPIGSMSSREMKIWTPAEFERFLEALGERNNAHKAAFITLYYTGLRIGELLALSLSDIDLDGGTLTVSKTFKRVNHVYVITEPKTKKSNRVVTLPDFVCSVLKEYIEANLQEISSQGRVFPFTRNTLDYTLKTYAKKAGLEMIRIHDLRHSHASLLISMGCEVNLISDRLGHERVSTTLDVYGHLYPSRRREIADKLDECCVGTLLGRKA